MKVTRVESPKQYSNGEYEPTESTPPDGYGGADEILYWYSVGDYCGAGIALLFKDGKVALDGLSHCSCYGPWEDEDTVFTFTDKLEVSAGMMEELKVFKRPDLFTVVGK